MTNYVAGLQANGSYALPSTTSAAPASTNAAPSTTSAAPATATGTTDTTYNSFLTSLGAFSAAIPNPGAPTNELSNIESFGAGLTATFNQQSNNLNAMVQQQGNQVFGQVMPFINATGKSLSSIGQQFANASTIAASNSGKKK